MSRQSWIDRPLAIDMAMLTALASLQRELVAGDGPIAPSDHHQVTPWQGPWKTPPGWILTSPWRRFPPPPPSPRPEVV